MKLKSLWPVGASRLVMLSSLGAADDRCYDPNDYNPRNGNPSDNAPNSTPWVPSIHDLAGEKTHPTQVVIRSGTKHPAGNKRSRVDLAGVAGKKAAMPVLRISPFVVIDSRLARGCANRVAEHGIYLFLHNVKGVAPMPARASAGTGGEA